MFQPSQSTAMRLSYAAVGGVAGASAWLLIEVVPEMIGNARLVLLVVAAGLGFFSMLLALLGPVRLIPAVAAAIAMAVPAAGLLLWASFRHVDVDGFLGHGYAPVAFVYLLAIAAPFAVAALQRHGGWRHYGILFDAAWALVVRWLPRGCSLGSCGAFCCCQMRCWDWSDWTLSRI